MKGLLIEKFLINDCLAVLNFSLMDSYKESINYFRILCGKKRILNLWPSILYIGTKGKATPSKSGYIIYIYVYVLYAIYIYQYIIYMFLGEF